MSLQEHNDLKEKKTSSLKSEDSTRKPQKQMNTSSFKVFDLFMTTTGGHGTVRREKRRTSLKQCMLGHGCCSAQVSQATPDGREHL
ncbi:hypothetical protein EYF80_064713 [Liparis tanakae]|uniref:Uncharacterized protein n=1 Tax=Liparis tanakae TaxID=230148 RepID=A0A4Z2E8N3_9TELE|nr:hypothetical protein EYF80_064713 [Liparis tanakae]